MPEEKDLLNTLASIFLEELLALIVNVARLPLHIRVLWGVEYLAVDFANSTDTDRWIVAFSREVVEDTLASTIKIPP